ncbi:AlpA family transcriptional regulator [Salmonella enterica subsp. enterica serovar Enteritidis]|nr:AlpA family transcriptional regulator [Salmonella enterica subsp. enterica serovar Enteritidis]MBW5978703.1 AlpA family transcriptional regulator [Klebsiella michiganensis]QXW41496.1 AlpA family phage regulatory protein [Klebsiella grimontii]
MGNKIIKVDEVIQRCAISKATLYRLIAESQFPTQVLLSKRAVGFYEHEVNEWINSRTRIQ